MHHPFGLMAPATIEQVPFVPSDNGGVNAPQLLHRLPSFG
jgi:hypothetical protein